MKLACYLLLMYVIDIDNVQDSKVAFIIIRKIFYEIPEF
jgi:hypothetical protein